MQAGEANLLAEAITGFKFLIAFPWEANHDICGHCQLRDQLPSHIHRPLIVGGGIAPSHALQHRMAAALKREMKVAAKPTITPELDK